MAKQHECLTKTQHFVECLFQATHEKLEATGTKLCMKTVLRYSKCGIKNDHFRKPICPSTRMAGTCILIVVRNTRRNYWLHGKWVWKTNVDVHKVTSFDGEPEYTQAIHSVTFRCNPPRRYYRLCVPFVAWGADKWEKIRGVRLYTSLFEPLHKWIEPAHKHRQTHSVTHTQAKTFFFTAYVVCPFQFCQDMFFYFLGLLTHSVKLCTQKDGS